MPTARFLGSCTAIPTACCSWSPGTCPVYCRYCTRSRIVGSQDGDYEFSTTQWERAIDYIARTPVIRDVLLSGGDPLLLSDDRLEWLLSRLRRIPHVEFLRIGTKVPGRAAAAHHAGAHADAAALPPALDEPALHPPRRADAGSRAGLRAARRCRHSARQPDAAARRASTTAWTCASGCFTDCSAAA